MDVRKVLFATASVCFTAVSFFLFVTPSQSGTAPMKWWRVEEVRAGMKGTGRTVIKGTKIETFRAAVLGVLKNTSPGRDLILCRLSGCNLEKTGVIAGMSGSPVYIDGKLLGAVAYAWQFGKEPIAGVTPFCQMRRYAKMDAKQMFADKNKPQRISLLRPLKLSGKEFKQVNVSEKQIEPARTAGAGFWLTPLRTPLAATGFSKNSLALLGKQLEGYGMIAMQSGAVTAHVARKAERLPLQPGASLSVAMIQGDFDLSGIGTVTHVEGKRVWGWGHPFMSLGRCDIPMMTGFVHAIYPRQSLSFKMGSPLRTVGVVNADVSTCIAGRLEQKPDMLPVQMTVQMGNSPAKTFQVRTIRHRVLLSNLVYTCLVNSVDMEGELPRLLTAEVRTKIEVVGRAPIVMNNVFSGRGFAGKRAPRAMYTHIADMVYNLVTNRIKRIRLKRIECTTRILPGRRSATIDAVELNSEVFRPGETIEATVSLKKHDGTRFRKTVSVKLPNDLKEGRFTAYLSNDARRIGDTIRDNPHLYSPQSLKHVFQAIDLRSRIDRTRLVLRVPLEENGVALEDKSLPKLPASMVHILTNSRRTGTSTLSDALVAGKTTAFVIHGSESVRFRVSRRKNVTIAD